MKNDYTWKETQANESESHKSSKTSCSNYKTIITNITEQIKLKRKITKKVKKKFH